MASVLGLLLAGALVHAPAWAADAAPLAQLRLEREGARYVAWADNRLQGPVEVELRYRQADNVTATPRLPARAVVPAGGSVVVARFYPGDARQGNELALAMDALPGDPRARAGEAIYRLPFAQAQVRVDQAFGGGHSHRDEQNHYAVDFALAEGTPVLAARRGTIMQVEQDSHDGPGQPANLVRVLHEDGSMAVYAHLKQASAWVSPGQVIDAGQVLALSGNTGQSTAPHLHFAVQLNRGMRLVSIPFRMQGPAGELRFPRSD